MKLTIIDHDGNPHSMEIQMNGILASIMGVLLTALMADKDTELTIRTSNKKMEEELLKVVQA